MKELLFPAVVWALQLSDWGITRFGVEGGMVREGMPGTAQVIALPNGWIVLLALKAISTLFMFLAVLIIPKDRTGRVVSRVVQVAWVATCASPVIWNLYVLRSIA
jgi:hypothetical protein